MDGPESFLFLERNSKKQITSPAHQSATVSSAFSGAAFSWLLLLQKSSKTIFATSTLTKKRFNVDLQDNVFKKLL